MTNPKSSWSHFQHISKTTDALVKQVSCAVKPPRGRVTVLLLCPMRWHFKLEMSDRFLILEKYPAKGSPHRRSQRKAPRADPTLSPAPQLLPGRLRARRHGESPARAGCHGDSPALTAAPRCHRGPAPAGALGPFARHPNV